MHRPKDTSDLLGVSPATLRLWSNHFAAVLSPAAQKSTTEAGTAAQRRYTDSDIAYFRRAKQHLADGKTYEDTLTALQSEPIEQEVEPSTQDQPTQINGASTPSLVTETHPIIHAFEEALKSKDETIEALRAQIALLEQRPTVPAATVAPTRFRWQFLNRLLLDVGQSDGA